MYGIPMNTYILHITHLGGFRGQCKLYIYIYYAYTIFHTVEYHGVFWDRNKCVSLFIPGPPVRGVQLLSKKTSPDSGPLRCRVMLVQITWRTRN